MKPISLQDWEEEMRESLAKFIEYWLAKHKLSPEEFPLEMLSGDWDEQFMFGVDW